MGKVFRSLLAHPRLVCQTHISAGIVLPVQQALHLSTRSLDETGASGHIQGLTSVISSERATGRAPHAGAWEVGEPVLCELMNLKLSLPETTL